MKKLERVEEGHKGNSDYIIVEDDISNTPSFEEPVVSSSTQARENLTKHNCLDVITFD